MNFILIHIIFVTARVETSSQPILKITNDFAPAVVSNAYNLIGVVHYVNTIYVEV